MLAKTERVELIQRKKKKKQIFIVEISTQLFMS